MDDMKLGCNSNMKIVVDGKVIDNVDLVVIEDNIVIYKEDNKIQIIDLQEEE